MVFALYVLVGLTRPLDVLHSDLSREARADLVENRSGENTTKPFSTKNKNTKTQNENNKMKITNYINENRIRNKRKHEKQNHDNNNMVPAAKNKNLFF
jgi:hypothetical protein